MPRLITRPDYAGELVAKVDFRITDKDNTPSPSGRGAATTVVFPYSFAIPCASTTDDTLGSTCAVSTTADALVPGAIKEGLRAVWQADKVEVLDGGPDGEADTADNEPFLRQGIFVP